MDGIEELCSFLDVKFMFPLHSGSARIDQALDAIEQKEIQFFSPKTQPVPAPTAVPTASLIIGGYYMPENAFMYSSMRRLQNGLPAAELQQRHQDEPR